MKKKHSIGHKIIKIIPNTLTSCNLLCGCIAIVKILTVGDLETATYYILAAAVFDFFDGFAARLLNAKSSIGLQLDSLADMVSFGLAPATIIFYNLSNVQGLLKLDLPEFIPFTAFLIAVFSALRLAKFNIDTRQTTSFIGLPTPACAMFICGTVYFQLYSAVEYYILLGLIPALCTLLVCELPMFSLKLKKTEKSFIRQYKVQIIFLFLSLVMLIVWQWQALSLIIGLYILLSLIIPSRYQKE